MDKFRNEIGNSLLRLPYKGKILFAALTIEKLYPNYIAFEDRRSWGNHLVLSEGISLIYQYLIKEDLFTDKEIKELINNIDVITPDTDDFPGILTSFALDACTSILDTLQFIIDKDDKHIINVSIYARDTVDMFIQEREDMNSLDPSIEIQIEHDNFMIEEKARQKLLIEALLNTNLEVITDQLLDKLRNNKPIIDLSLLSNL